MIIHNEYCIKIYRLHYLRDVKVNHLKAKALPKEEEKDVIH